MSRQSWRGYAAVPAVATLVALLAWPAGATAGATAATTPALTAVSGLARTAAAPAAPAVAVSIASVSPIAPPAIATDTLVSIVVSVTNNTATSLQRLSIQAVRDVPIARQSALNTMLAHPTPPFDNDLTQPLPSANFSQSIAAHRTLQLTYQVNASTTRLFGGVCLCQDGIYPIDLSVYAASGGAAVARVGWAQTYLISVTNSPAPVQVSWLWPLIDRPHRLTDGNAFIDDDLAAEVTSGGRLDRALQVLEQVGSSSKVTVVIDPELIDELAVMAKGYRIDNGTTIVTGTGGPAAAAWLARLSAVIARYDITLTPYADPAIDAVAQAGLFWSATLPKIVQQQVEQALGRLPSTTLAWPPGSTVTPAALQQLADDGTKTIVVNDATLPAGRTAIPALDAVATVAVGGTAVQALVTSQALEQRVAALLAPSGSQLAGLPALLSELAIRTVEDATHSSYVVLTPDRYIDTNPATAAAVIAATEQSSWSVPIAATVAATQISPVDHGSLAPPTVPQSVPETIATAASTSTFVREFSAAVSPAGASSLLADYPAAIQFSESAGWSTDPDAALEFVARLENHTLALAHRVQLVRPSNGSYSLASSSAPLLVTVTNMLPVAVNVRVQLSSVGGVAGFRADDIGVQTIPANSRRTIKVEAHVARSGHFRIQALLLMPDGGRFGPPLQLTIYSTALGTVGVVITVIALAVLAIALINRFVRRWRHHRALVRMMTREQPVPAGARG